jgi:tetratricopeptide (TPR) repeat protein
MAEQGPATDVMTIDQVLAQAHAHWQAGQAGQAESLCQQVLAQYPGQADTLHLLGVMAHAQGDLPKAIKQLRQACQAPGAPAAYFSNLAEMCRQGGLLAEAEVAGRRAIGLAPQMAAAWNNLGIILQEAGKLDESLACLGKVVALNPDDPLARNNIGNTCMRMGRLAAAREHYEAALALHPHYAQALNNLATLLDDLGEADLALATVKRAIDAEPRLADAYINAARIETGRRDLGQALRWIEALLSFAPGYADGLQAKAGVLLALGRPAEALILAQQAVRSAASSETLNGLGEILQASGQAADAMAAFKKAETAGGFAQAKARMNRAMALMETGARVKAKAALGEALRINPRSAPAWLAMSDLKRYAPGDPDIAAMESLLDSGGLESHGDRMALHFALGKAWMDAEDPAKAFTHLDAGNALQRRTVAYDAAEAEAEMATIAALFPPALFERLAGAGAPSEVPVFVIGMPRSGTTLIEQILASHPQVHGAGELDTLRQLSEAHGGLSALSDNLTSDLARHIGQAYADQVAALTPRAARVIDKMPSNFLMAGLIPLILPQARVIHVRRDPVDTGLSIYGKLFARPQPFAYDLAEIGRYHRAYQALMAHWRAVLPKDRFLEVAYEGVVADLEGQARRMTAFLDLDWNPACLRFDKTQRTVRTASLNQVRQPLYNDSVGRWRPYAAHLRPLLDALGIPAP